MDKPKHSNCNCENCTCTPENHCGCYSSGCSCDNKQHGDYKHAKENELDVEESEHPTFVKTTVVTDSKVPTGDSI